MSRYNLYQKCIKYSINFLFRTYISHNGNKSTKLKVLYCTISARIDAIKDYWGLLLAMRLWIFVLLFAGNNLLFSKAFKYNPPILAIWGIKIKCTRYYFVNQM